MRKTLRYLFTPNLPGYIPDPNAKRSAKLQTDINIYILTLGFFYLVYRDQIKEALGIDRDDNIVEVLAERWGTYRGNKVREEIERELKVSTTPEQWRHWYQDAKN